MKTAGRENPNRRATVPCNRAPGAAAQNRSCSFKWAAKQENVQPLQMCFFLTSLFIELTRSCPKFELCSNASGCMLCYKGTRVSSVDVLIVILLIPMVGPDEEEDG